MTAASRALLTDARIVTCSGDLTEQAFDGDVLIEGDRIAEVFRGSRPILDGPVEVVDLAGATVIPGLCDAHTHISWPLDFVFNHPEIAAMPDDEHALEVAGGRAHVPAQRVHGARRCRRPQAEGRRPGRPGHRAGPDRRARGICRRAR